MANWQAVAQLSDLPEGAIHKVSPEGIDVILVRVEGEVAAYLDSCPHEGHPLSLGELEGDVIVCAKHLWEFDARNGKHITRVPRPQNDLRKAPVRLVGEKVEVDVDALF
jgi:nitrite reductase/ring-hydroxylating ferredoxin subunit